MFNGTKVVIVTRVGRVPGIERLAKYLLRDKGLIDEYRLWADTEDAYALSKIHTLACYHPDFFSVSRPTGVASKTQSERHDRVCTYIDDCKDENTVYIRLADDICWLKEDAVLNLVKFRLANPQYFAVYPAVVNQGRTMYIHQVMGHVPEKIMPRWEGEYIDHLDLRTEPPHLAEILHKSLLAKIKSNDTDLLKFSQYQIPNYEIIPVHAITWLGKDLSFIQKPMAQVIGPIPEEVWWSEVGPKLAGKTNCICGTSIVAHYAFSNQASYLATTEIEEQYADLAPAPSPTGT